MNAHHAYIVDGIRTPIGKFQGSLSGIRADDLGAWVLKALMERHPHFDPAQLDDVLMGCANQAGEDNRNVARMALLLAGLPWTVPGETINRLCASGLSAVAHAHRAIRSGEARWMIAGGVEHMTRAPYVVGKPTTGFGTDAKMYDSSFGWRFVNPLMHERFGTEAMGETAENLVERFGISRVDQDRFAHWSQEKAESARKAGYLAEEIAEVRIPGRKGQETVVAADEFPRPETTMEALAGLRPAFRKEGSVTAGNSSGLNDGAAALLMGSGHAIAESGKPALARVVSAAVSGVEPRIMGIGPVEASQKALAIAGLELKQMDWIEINEAFAAQVLACTRSLGLDDRDDRINPNGGAIALGHPLGMSGARIALSAARQLQRSQTQYALVTMCIGVGQGYAMVLERA
ncbi:3-oxoadipyl-CoA thiolase [bacterium]|nr:3-oxoadipyl-CoA thiolase [bacterium]